MARLGYIRTSTNKQHTDRQINQLKRMCDKIFIEKGVSATKKNRPEYQKLLKELEEGDELLVVAYDRAYRDVVEGLTSLDYLTEQGVKLVSVTQSNDPTTPYGRAVFTISITFAELEIGNLRQRTVDGLNAARLRGSRLGRPRKGETRRRKKAA